MAKFRHGTLWVLTANDLLTGDVVFLTAKGSWSGDLDQARIADTPRDAAALEELTTDQQVERATVAAYTIEVERQTDGRIRPVRRRECIRILGPLAGSLSGFKTHDPATQASQKVGSSVARNVQFRFLSGPDQGGEHVSL